ncbi:MAG: heme-binding protein [Pseudomonadales bacterium]|jgi:uncharacterized protein GlcG (DUF336 family)|nr:heme-binding protein [Pseudomonadales bacterium]
MKRFPLMNTALCVLASLSVTTALAQAPAAPAPAPRAAAPALTPAVEAAQAAVAACAADGYKVTVLITDADGETVVLLSGDGAALRTQGVARSKVAAALKYQMSSGEVAEKARNDAAFDAEIKADPAIGTARQGAVLIKNGDAIIGAFAVSGAPGGDKDEACITAALAKVALN